MHYGFDARPNEEEAMKELCSMLDLSPENVLRQAFRTYQSIKKGAYELKPTYPILQMKALPGFTPDDGCDI